MIKITHEENGDKIIYLDIPVERLGQFEIDNDWRASALLNFKLTAEEARVLVECLSLKKEQHARCNSNNA